MSTGVQANCRVRENEFDFRDLCILSSMSCPTGHIPERRA